jgi:hypothetical protein
VRNGYIRERFTIPNNYASHYILISMAGRYRPIRNVGFINVVYEELIKFEYYWITLVKARCAIAHVHARSRVTPRGATIRQVDADVRCNAPRH